MAKIKYPTDLTDTEWEVLKDFFAKIDNRGRKPLHSSREIINAIFYLTRTGCQWRMLPSDFPHWKTVYSHFRLWKLSGVWEKSLKHLTEQARLAWGKKSRAEFRYHRFTERKNGVWE